MKPAIRLFDIAANLADDRYNGDLGFVLKRAKEYGVEKLLLGGTYLADSAKSYEIAMLDENYYCTMGVHPCRANEPSIQHKSIAEYFAELEQLIQKCQKGKLIGIGECGLDYDRLSYASKETQLQYGGSRIL